VSDKPGWIRRLPILNAKDIERIRRGYETEIESLQAVDDLVEAVDALKSVNRLDDTIIIFTSDNGFVMGEHRLEGKIAPYKGSIKVPLIIEGLAFPRIRSVVNSSKTWMWLLLSKS
jgi:N-acetylglucosamine-6-sulfatase